MVFENKTVVLYRTNDYLGFFYDKKAIRLIRHVMG